MPGANHYRIFWFQNGNWEFKAWTPGTSVHFTGLTPNTQYFFGVRAVDANGRESAGSPYRAVWTLANVQPPAAPGWVNSSNVQQTTLTLSWGAAAGATHYFLYWRPNANHSWTDLGWVTGTSRNISNLVPGSWNEFAVRGWNSSGLGAWSPVHGVRMGSTVPVPQPPGAPTSLSAMDITHNSARLRWNAPTSGAIATSYRIYRNGSFFRTATSTSIVLDDLTPNMSRNFHVVAVSAAGLHSGPSNTVSVRTLPAPGWADYEFSARVNHFFDQGFFVYHDVTQARARTILQDYHNETNRIFRESLSLYLERNTPQLWQSPADTWKIVRFGGIRPQNIDAIDETGAETRRTTLRDAFNRDNRSARGLTNAFWSGHNIQTMFNNDPLCFNRSWSNGRSANSNNGSIFQMGRWNTRTNAGNNRAVGVLIHEMAHQFAAPDHYHEWITVDGERVCRGGDMCADPECGNPNPRPEWCIMNHSGREFTIGQASNGVFCNRCRNDMLAQLRAHHRN